MDVCFTEIECVSWKSQKTEHRRILLLMEVYRVTQKKCTTMQLAKYQANRIVNIFQLGLQGKLDKKKLHF